MTQFFRGLTSGEVSPIAGEGRHAHHDYRKPSQRAERRSYRFGRIALRGLTTSPGNARIIGGRSASDRGDTWALAWPAQDRFMTGS
jgi:hypothetical protein